MKKYGITLKYHIVIILGLSQFGFNIQTKAATFPPLDSQNESYFNSSSVFNAEPESLGTDIDSLLSSEKDFKNQRIVDIINYMKQHQYRKAHDQISELLKQTPNDPTLYNLLAITNRQENKLGIAKNNFKKAFQLDSKNIVALHGMASIALSEGNLEEAKDFFTEILRLDTNYSKAYVALAVIAEKKGDKKEAENLLRQAYDKESANLKPTIDIAKALLHQYASEKSTDKVDTLSEDIIKKFPNQPEAFAFQVNALIQTNRQEQAEKFLRKMIAQKPDEMIHRVALANLISKQPGRQKDVIEIADEIIALNPEKLQSYILKANYLIEQRLFPQALEVAEQTEKLFPKFSIGAQLKGQVYSASGDTAKSIQAYQEANQIQPDTKLTLIIADLMHRQGQTKEAITLLTKDLERNTELTNHRLALAVFLQQGSESGKAKEQYEIILKQHPDNIVALNNLASIYSQENNPKAIELAEQAYRLSPNSASTTDTLGYILIKNGKPQEGLALLQKAAKAAPLATDIQVHLAEGLVLSNQTEEAVKILITLTKENNFFPEREQALKLLKSLNK